MDEAEIKTVTQFVDGGHNTPDLEVGRTYRITMSEATLKEWVDGTQTWVVTHYVA